jgi:hypothetical protein
MGGGEEGFAKLVVAGRAATKLRAYSLRAKRRFAFTA